MRLAETIQVGICVRWIAERVCYALRTLWVGFCLCVRLHLICIFMRNLASGCHAMVDIDSD